MLQYLVVLAGTDPLVWRRIRVPAAYSFWDLHVAIQDSMGWFDYHLHEFRVLDPRSGTVSKLGIPDDDGWDDQPTIAGWLEFPLDYTTGSPAPIQYTYDFGDDWSHALIFEGFEQAPGRRKPRPECVGARFVPGMDGWSLRSGGVLGKRRSVRGSGRTLEHCVRGG